VRTLLGVYDSVEAAGATVSAIIAQGIVPAALEMIDHLTIVAVEPNVHLGLPLDAQAALLVELDGPADVIGRQATAISALCREHGAREVREAKDEKERALLWKARKGAFGAMGRLANGFYVMDGVVPRTRMAEALRAIDVIAHRHDLRIANLAHAGDGNLHPNVLYDVDDPASVRRALLAAEEILATCVALGGSLSGEHGIGSEKRDLMGILFSPDDLAQFAALRDAWNPSGRLNPRKVLPLGKGCGEVDPRALAALGRRFAAAAATAPAPGAAADTGAEELPWI
jgi:glycolate oxidase